MRRKRIDPFGNDWFSGLFGMDTDFDSLFARVEEMMSSPGLDENNVRRYGFSLSMGPDGIPHIKEWGDHEPQGAPLLSERDCGGGGCGDGSCSSTDPDYAEAPGPRIPFPYNPEPTRPGPGRMNMGVRKDDLVYEVTDTEDGLGVYIELPGVLKEDIQLDIIDDRVLHLKVDSGQKKIDRVIQLPEIVDPNSIKAKANNGILEVMLKTRDKKTEAKNIQID
jgi:HSP20 family molecular chaperone IbpA